MLGLAVGPVAASAQWDLTNLIKTSARMGITQRTTAGLTRVWARTYDGRLVSKKPEVNDLGWYFMDTGVDTGPAALSYTDGSTQRQRVYYSRAGAIQQLNYDDEAWHGRVALPSPPAGTSFSGKAVAAVDWDDAGTRRTAVAAITTAGAVCVWQGTFTSGYGSPTCSSANTASTSNADIQGTVVGSTPAFFYRRSNNQLGSTARLFSFWFGYYWSSQSHGLPPGSSYIRESIAATPSLASSGLFEVVVGGSDGQPHVARANVFSPASTTWSNLPSMPSGGDVAWGRNSLSSVNYSYFNVFNGNQNLISLFVKGSNGALYRITTANGGGWTLAWKSGSVGLAAKPTHQRWLGNGVAAAEGDYFWKQPVLWGVGGSLPDSTYTGTLQMFSETGKFDDHLYYYHQVPNVNGINPSGGTSPATESTSSVSGIYGLSAAIRRNAPAPWEIGLVDTGVGGANWSNDFTVAIADGWPNPTVVSASDPYTAVDQETGLMHLLTLEVDISTTSETSCTNQNPSMQRMIYRRGWSASSIASMTSGSNLWVVGTGNADHGNLVLTRDASGTSAHVIWTGSAGSYNGTRIWTLSPSGATSEAHLTTFPGSPSGLFADAAQDLYAWTFPYMAGGGVTGFATLCKIDPATGACSLDQHPMAPTGVGTTGPLRPTAPLVRFSRVGATHPYACGGGTVGESCFQTAEHFSFVAHPTIPNRLYAVYQGIDPAGGTSIYFTIHEEDHNLQEWSAPVRVNARNSGDTTSLFVDSEITIDEDGAIIVTYTRVSDHMSGGTWAPSYIAVSTNDGASFSTEHLVGSWRPWDLPFHCSRQKHFLGEYRHPDVLGGRAFHAFHVSGGGNTILAGLLASRWAVRY